MKCNTATGPQILVAIWLVTSLRLAESAPTHSFNHEISTVVPWPGVCHIPGAHLLTIINLKHIQKLCLAQSSDLTAASQVIKRLANVKFRDLNESYMNRVAYILLRLEQKYANLIGYVDSINLCYENNMREMHSNFSVLRADLDHIWITLKQNYKPTRSLLITLLAATNITLTGNKTVTARRSPIPSQKKTLLTVLEGHRPPAPPQNFLLAAAGILTAFAGGAIASTLLAGGPSQEAIDAINHNLKLTTKSITLTNSRIDTLAANVSEALEKIEVILDEFVTYDKTRELTAALLFNLEQLTVSADISLLEFKAQQNYITLLQQGIINPDLIDHESLANIIKEGLSEFKNLAFPIQVEKETLPDIIKLLTIKSLYLNQFIIIIPLFDARPFKINSLIAHPIKLESQLVLPQVRSIIVAHHAAQKYIKSSEDHILEINNETHIMTQIEPIWDMDRSNCEIAVYQRDLEAILQACHYELLKSDNGTLLRETKKFRLAYFPQPTKVNLDCPDQRIKEVLEGVTSIPTDCDLTTDYVYWPARQSLDINLESLVSTTGREFEAIKLPPIKLNDTTKVHDTLKKIIEDVSDDKSLLTFDFKGYDLDIEEVQSYTIIAYGTLTVIVIVHSIILAVIVGNIIRRFLKNKRILKEVTSSPSAALRRARDSILERKSKLRKSLDRLTPTSSLRRAKYWRDSFRKRMSSSNPHKDASTNTYEEFELVNNLNAAPRRETRATNPKLYPQLRHGISVIPRY